MLLMMLKAILSATAGHENVEHVRVQLQSGERSLLYNFRKCGTGCGFSEKSRRENANWVKRAIPLEKKRTSDG